MEAAQPRHAVARAVFAQAKGALRTLRILPATCESLSHSMATHTAMHGHAWAWACDHSATGSRARSACNAELRLSSESGVTRMSSSRDRCLAA